ncbi:MAG: myosin light chain kinase [Trebouxia sp. A1-2]|nr:MAG: myosin light chain kinase [Trebouxia sp. A1-2]
MLNGMRETLHTRKRSLKELAVNPETHDSGKRVLSGNIVSAESLQRGTSTNGLLMYGFQVVDDEGKSKKLWCVTQQACQEWCHFLSHWANTEVLLSHWYHVQWSKLLGSGAFAAVVKATGKADHRPYAIKVVARSAYRHYYHMMNQEVGIMSMLAEHPHMVRLKQVLYAPHRLYIVTEYLDGGELSKRVSPGSPLTETDAARVTRQVLSALAALHDQRVCHMDIKPDNLIFENKSSTSPVKLIDFSLACFFSEPTEPGGTPEFMAPELVADPDGMAATGWGPEIDMWAVGILVFWMLCGRTPFDGDNVPQILQNIMQVCHGQQMMPLVATAGALVKLAGGKLEKGESGEGSTARGSLLGTTPHFSRSFSYTEGTPYGYALSSSVRTASAISIGPQADPSHHLTLLTDPLTNPSLYPHPHRYPFTSADLRRSLSSQHSATSLHSQRTSVYAHSRQSSAESTSSPAQNSPQVWDSMLPGTKDLDPMTAIPESHPVTQSVDYAVTADCTSVPVHSSSKAASNSHPASAALAGPSMRIRVTNRSISLVRPSSSNAGQGNKAVQSTPSQQNCQIVVGMTGDAAVQQQQSGHLPSCHSSSCFEASSLLQHNAVEHDTQQLSHTPLHGLSHAFGHENALTGAAAQGADSPLPQRAVSEQSSRAPTPSAVQHDSNGAALEICHEKADSRCEVSTSVECGCDVQPNYSAVEGEAHLHNRGKRQEEGQRDGGYGETDEVKGNVQEGFAGMALVDGGLCDTPISPRWWDNVAKTDLIGIKELQRAFLRAQKAGHLEKMVAQARLAAAAAAAAVASP